MLFLQNAGAKVLIFHELAKLFLYFCTRFSVFYMKKLKKGLGLGLMILGTSLFVVLHLLNLTFVNKLLLVPFCLILIGGVLYIYALKKDSRY